MKKDMENNMKIILDKDVKSIIYEYLYGLKHYEAYG